MPALFAQHAQVRLFTLCDHSIKAAHFHACCVNNPDVVFCVRFFDRTIAGIFRSNGLLKFFCSRFKKSQWGENCRRDCPVCYNNGTCDPVTGKCVCRPGM